MEILHAIQQIPGNDTAAQREELLDKLTANAWIITYSALWNGKKMKLEQSAHAMDHIKTFISKSIGYEKNYEEYVHRVQIGKFGKLGLNTRRKLSPLQWLTEKGYWSLASLVAAGVFGYSLEKNGKVP